MFVKLSLCQFIFNLLARFPKIACKKFKSKKIFMISKFVVKSIDELVKFKSETLHGHPVNSLKLIA